MFINNSQLSGRENEVAELLLEGKSNKQIALALGISTSTVEYHLTNIYKKLQVSSRTEAVLKLGKSPSNGLFGISIVEINNDPVDNDGKSISTRRLSMNKKLYGIGLFAVVLLATVLAFNMLTQDISVNDLNDLSATEVAVTSTIATSTIVPSSTPLSVEELPTYQGPVTFITEKASNIGDKVVTLKGAEIGPLASIVTVCVFSPDQQQWMPSVSLLYRGNMFSPTSMSLTDTKPSPGDELCYRLKYSLQFDPVDDPKQAIAVWVTKLTKDQPERLSNESISSAFQKLSAEGIEFTYVVGDHGSRIEIIKKPAELTDEEVSAMIQEALAEEALTSGVLIFDLK